jgi:VWFA-related protein
MRSTLAVALLVFAFSIHAQVQETVNVAVTNVDLIVTDSKGKPVHGLTKDDFELFEGNRKREITNLSELSAGAPAAGTALTPQMTTAPSRAVLVLFDNTSLTLAMRRQAAVALKSWLAGQLRPVDRIAIVTAIPSLQTKQPWTFDSRAANAAVDVVAGESTSVMEQQRREARARIDEVVHRAATAGQNETVKFDEATQAVRTYAASSMRDISAVVSAMTAALTYFPPSAQKKVMIIVGEGITTNPGSDLFQYLNSVKMDIESGNGPSMLQAGARTSSPLTEAGEYDVAPATRAMTAAALRDGVMIYAINPGQNENSSGQVLDSAPGDVRSQFATSSGNRAGYEMIVRATGGTAFYGAPPALALAQISSDLDGYYSVGFKPGPAAETGPLVVKSKAGYKVRATRAPAPQSSDDKMREAVLAHHVAAPMSNDLKIALAADRPVAVGDSRTVRLKVLIPVASLKLDAEGQDVVGGFVVYLSSGDDHGGATRVNRQEHQIRWSAGAFESLKSKTITFAVDVIVPAGLTQISVGVMDARSQQTGFERVTLGV